MRWWILFLLLTLPTWAEPWTQKGKTWFHSNGMEITFHDEFKVSQTKDGILSATAKGGFVNLTFTPVHGKEDMKGVMGSVQQVFNIRKVELETETHNSKQNGLDLAYQDGKATINDIDYLVKLGVFNKKEDFLVMQLLVPRKLLPKTEKMLRAVLGSVK